MKRLLLLPALLLFVMGCSKDDDTNQQTLPNSDVAVTSSTHSMGDFSYKKFVRSEPGVVRGLIILAHGDGGSVDDSTLNDQCYALAQQGFVAATTSYRNPTGTVNEINSRFYSDVEGVYAQLAVAHNVPLSKTVLGGLSRGGNLTYSLILPGQPGVNMPVSGIKGAVLECSGGDEWKGSAVVVPVAFMSNQTDNVMGMGNANEFKTGLENNANANVSSASECLIIGGEGHCGGSNQYKAFLVNKMIEWFPE